MGNKKKWKVKKRQDVSVSKWMQLEKHEVELPSGKIIDDYYINIIGNVAIFVPFLITGDLVLVRQYKHAYGEVLIELPAGFQMKGKTIEQSAVLELEEETGIKTTTNKLISLGSLANNPTKTTHTSYGFLVKALEFNSEQQFETTEDIDVLTVKPKACLEMVRSGKIKVADSVAFILKANMIYPAIFQ